MIEIRIVGSVTEYLSSSLDRVQRGAVIERVLGTTTSGGLT